MTSSTLSSDWTLGLLLGSLGASDHGLHRRPLVRTHLERTDTMRTRRSGRDPGPGSGDTNLAKVVKLARHRHKFTSIKADHLQTNWDECSEGSKVTVGLQASVRLTAPDTQLA